MIDSHAHLDMPEFSHDIDEVIARAKGTGVTAIINVGCDLDSSRRAIELADKYPQIYAAVGFHPHDAAKIGEGDLDKLKELSRCSKVVAIGEIGLDFYRNLSPREAQLKALAQQLELAQNCHLPVIIHSRAAQEKVDRILLPWARRWPKEGENRHPGVLHCFSGDQRVAQLYSQMGFLISFAGPVTYPTAHQLLEVMRSVPLECLLVETDCPFLAPHPHRNTRNEPSNLRTIIAKIAEVKEIPFPEVAKATEQNAIRLFGLPIRG